MHILQKQQNGRSRCDLARLGWDGAKHLDNRNLKRKSISFLVHMPTHCTHKGLAIETPDCCDVGGLVLNFVEFLRDMRNDVRHYHMVADIGEVVEDLKTKGALKPLFRHLCEFVCNLYCVLHRQWKPRHKRSTTDKSIGISRAQRRKPSYARLCTYHVPSLSTQASLIAAHRGRYCHNQVTLFGMTIVVVSVGFLLLISQISL